MVLSNKKSKRRLRAESARQQGSLLLAPDKLNKREKKRQRRQQLESSPAQQPAPPETLLSPSFRQGQDAEKQSQVAEVSLPPTVNNEQIALSVDNSSSPVPSAKSRKQKKALKTNVRTEELDEKAVNHSAEDQDSSESRTVYVGGIPYYSSEDDIKAFFGECGTISEVNLKTFGDSGKFCGIALLTFKTLGGAQRALALDGSNMGDRFLKIQPSAAKPKEPVKKEAYNAPPTKTQGYTRAYIGNLSWSVTEEDIRDFFEGCKVDKVKFSEDKVTGDFRGFGHVDFADDESLERALQLDQQILLERPIKVAYAVPSRTEKRAGPAARDTKDITCHTCGEKGHVLSRCPYMGRGQ